MKIDVRGYFLILIMLFCLPAVTFAEEHPFQGKHVLGELYGVEPDLLNDVDLLENTLKQGIIDSGATYIGTVSEKFTPHGVTILILIAESHVSIHTYPEHKALFFDAFTCGECDPKVIADLLVKKLNPQQQNVQVLARGK